MTLGGLLIFAAAYVVATASPGPGVAAVVARVLAKGTHGMPGFIAGFVTGDLIWFSIAAAGLAVLAQTFAAVSAVTPHLCMPELKARSPLPLVDIVDVLIRRLRERQVNRVALLGTRFTMESRPFGRLEEVDVIDLACSDREQVHRIYLSIASNGAASPADTIFLKELCRRLHEVEGAHAIVLAGTELSLVLHEGEGAFPLVDCAQAHVKAITERALETV